MIKNSPANAGDVSLSPTLGRSPGVGNGNPLQYSCLEDSMDREGWWATPWDCKDMDMTEHACMHAHTHVLPLIRGSGGILCCYTVAIGRLRVEPAIFLGQGPSNLNVWSPVESLPAPSKSLTAGALSTVQYGAVVPRIPSASKTFIYQSIHAFIQREDFTGEVSLELVFEKEK